MTLPSIAVVIPCWNSERWIARAIGSVLAQGYPGLDVVVVDDGSTDGGLEIVKAFGGPVRWQTGPNRGACAARNTGLGLVASDYVLFLDADDSIEAPLLLSLGRSAGGTSAGEAPSDLVFGPSALEYPDGSRKSKVRFGAADTPVSIFPRILGEDWVPPHSILWRADFVRFIGGWNERMVRNQDGELLARALLKVPRLAFAAEGCAVYVQHASPDRVSTRNTLEAIACQIEHFELRAREARNTTFEDASRPVMALHAYNLARASFTRDCALLGRRALRLARELGFRGHRGSRAHKISASILGLELKEALSGLYWGLVRKTPRARSAFIASTSRAATS